MASNLPEEIRELVDMHYFCRPHGSTTEAQFVNKYIDSLNGVVSDKVGNRIGQIGDSPTIMWSSHTDTVHKVHGFQSLMWGNDILSLASNSKSNCLGADCTVGVWLMRQMYLAKVPGLYIWHAGEECGGVGSTYIADNSSELLTGINHAIAFDRRGYYSVITEQWAGRCASDEFATEFAKRLSTQHKPDDTGVFTDTANYRHLVPECTNISVGYTNEHTSNETLNTAYAVWLLEKLKTMDLTNLPVVRKVTDIHDVWSNYEWGSYMRSDSKNKKHNTKKKSSVYVPKTEQERTEEVIWQYAEEMAELMLNYGYTAETLREELVQVYRKNRNKKVDTSGGVYKLYGGS